MADAEVHVCTTLSAKDLSGGSSEDDGVFTFWIHDDEDLVEISHEFGDPEVSAAQLEATAKAMVEHAERIRYRARMRSAGWT